MGLDAWRKCLEINPFGAIHCIRMAARVMTGQHFGSNVNMSVDDGTGRVSSSHRLWPSNRDHRHNRILGESFPRLGPCKTCQAIWNSANSDDLDAGTRAFDEAENSAQERLSRNTPLSRRAPVLTAMEGFTNEDAGYLVDNSVSEVQALVDEGLAEIERQTAADVFIIEDEPIIPMDLETIVHALGYSVIGVAVMRDEAVHLAPSKRPGLVLVNIQLADNSLGIDAVETYWANSRFRES